MRQMSFFCCFAIYATQKFTRPLRNNMGISMFLGCYQNKIVQTVVLSIAIFMMYMNTLWSICKNAMFVFPFIWLCNFYSNVNTSIAGFMKTLASNWKLNANLIYNSFFSCFCLFGQSFIGTIRTARGIMVSIAISPFFANNGISAKWTLFSKKSFHAHSIYQA